VGRSSNTSSTASAMSAGAFDSAYYASASGSNPTGNLYVCGYASATALRPTLWKTTIANNAFNSATEGPLLVGGNTSDGCSPVTIFKNGGTEYLYVSVTANGAANDGGGCASPNNGCIYAAIIQSAGSFDTTSANSSIADNLVRYFSVSTPAPLNTNEASVTTTLTAAQAGTYTGMAITQGGNSPGGTNFTYFLRKNGANTAITCTVLAGVGTCSDATNSASFSAGDTIDVSVQRTLGTGTINNRTFRVQLGFNASASLAAGLSARGGTGGIIIDNTLPGGGSQIYYSTRTSPGNAVQASQAALQ